MKISLEKTKILNNIKTTQKHLAIDNLKIKKVVNYNLHEKNTFEDNTRMMEHFFN